jgi:hypothetical protein
MLRSACRFAGRLRSYTWQHLLVCLLGLTLPASALAVPSIFPEDAAFATVGYGDSVGGTVGLEVVLPVRYLDVSAGLEAYAPVADISKAGLRASGTALVFPAFGTTPPLAVGLGGDAGYGPDGWSAHAGPLVGTDLLFSLRLPMTASLYLAPGYASSTGFSLAWAAQVRYYFDSENVALEISSTDLFSLSLGVRVLF